MSVLDHYEKQTQSDVVRAILRYTLGHENCASDADRLRLLKTTIEEMESDGGAIIRELWKALASASMSVINHVEYRILDEGGRGE